MSRRTALLAAGALGAGAVAAWRLAAPPPLPELTARRAGDLVHLDTAAGADLSRGFEFGLGGDAGAAAVSVDRAAVEAPAAAQRLGAATSPVLVAFLDYRCGPCRQHAEPLLAGARAGRYRLLVRDWPILGPPSELAARAALAAAEQNAYWPFHAALMATGFVPTMGLVATLAERHGLDAVRLRADMNAEPVGAALRRNAALARGLGGVGTPLYVVDGVVVAGGWGPATLLALAERHRP